MKTLSESDIEQFWKSVDITDPDKCWTWKGGHSSSVYGQFKHQLAHRVSWTIANNANPGEMFVCHTCDNPICVNPAHLFLGTNLDNIKDMCQKGRHSYATKKGEDCITHKLTSCEVQEIREKYKPRQYSTRLLAREYHISQTQIRNILAGISWAHL